MKANCTWREAQGSWNSNAFSTSPDGTIFSHSPVLAFQDNLVSYFHFYRAIKFFNFSDGTWEQFFSLYKDKKIVHGDWFDFNLSWWQHRDDPNVLIITYEDMKTDIYGVIKKMSDFIKKPISDEVLNKIVKHTAFDQMRDNKMVNYEFSSNLDTKVSKFMRKGQVGDWVNYFTPEQLELVDQQLKKKLDGTGLSIRET